MREMILYVHKCFKQTSDLKWSQIYQNEAKWSASEFTCAKCNWLVNSSHCGICWILDNAVHSVKHSGASSRKRETVQNRGRNECSQIQKVEFEQNNSRSTTGVASGQVYDQNWDLNSTEHLCRDLKLAVHWQFPIQSDRASEDLKGRMG